MTFRALWIISLSPSLNSSDVVFSRKYTSVERRAKKLYDRNYCTIPDNKQFLQCLFSDLGVVRGNEFLKTRDTCDKLVQLPAISLNVSNGCLWPLVVNEKNGFLYCGLIFVDDTLKFKKKMLSDISGVSVSISLLQGIAEFMETVENVKSTVEQRIIELGNILSICLPFGSVVDADILNLQTLLSSKALAVAKSDLKQSAWKPNVFKGKSSITIQSNEFIRSIQHENKSKVQDNTDIFGSMYCKAELDGATAYNVSVALVSQNLNSELNIQNILYHSCISPLKSSIAENNSSLQLKFSPPSHRIKLIDYVVPNKFGPPIFGIYKFQGLQNSDVLLQLSINENMKNSFEFCEARLPFYNRGKIKNVDCHPTVGSVSVSNDRRSIIWNIGTKFPTRGSTIYLSATIQFMDYNAEECLNDDPFCNGLNAFAQINFKANDFSFSEFQIDQRYVNTTPSSKFKFSFGTDLNSVDYKIWNSNGESPLVTK